MSEPMIGETDQAGGWGETNIFGSFLKQLRNLGHKENFPWSIYKTYAVSGFRKTEKAMHKARASFPLHHTVYVLNLCVSKIRTSSQDSLVSRSQDSMLPGQGARDPPLVRETDPPCCN